MGQYNKEQECFFPNDVLLVSKTDTRGIITYANETFIAVSGYSEEELIGQPHNLVRHPDMPRVIFKILWSYLKAGSEINLMSKTVQKVAVTTGCLPMSPLRVTLVAK